MGVLIWDGGNLEFWLSMDALNSMPMGLSGTHEFWVDISSVPNALSGCTIINDLCLNSTHSNSLKNL